MRTASVEYDDGVDMMCGRIRRGVCTAFAVVWAVMVPCIPLYCSPQQLSPLRPLCPLPPAHSQKLEPALLGPRVVLAYDQMLVGFAAYPEVRIYSLIGSCCRPPSYPVVSILLEFTL